MNRAHRVVWSEARGAFVVAHEFASGRGKGSSTKTVLAASIAAAMLTLTGTSLAQTTTISTPSDAQTLVTGETLVNNSTITSTNSRQVAVLATGGVTAGAIINNGAITQPTVFGLGILVTNSTLTGGITNAGTISAPVAILIQSGASSIAGITNSGVITGVTGGVVIGEASIGTISNVAGATIAGGLSLYEGTASSVINAGSISGMGIGTSESLASLQNSGTIGSGIRISSGARVGSITNSGLLGGISVYSSASVSNVLNQSGGVISGGIYAANATLGTIVNSAGGTISSTPGNGISLVTAGAVAIVNAGRISGGYTGVLVANSPGASVTNSGTITGVLGAGVEFGGVNLTNLSGALISGGTLGLGVLGGTSVVNSGTIMSTGSSSGDDGVQIFSTQLGTFSNLAGGVISGASGVEASNSTISSFLNAGDIAGIHGVGFEFGQIGSFANSGTISGADTALGIYGAGVGSVVNQGTISASLYGAIISGATISKGISNSGLISGTGDGGMILQSDTITGGVNNLPGGVLSGASGLTLYYVNVDNISNAANATISGLTLNGLHVTSESTVTGNITNAGVISGLLQGVYVNSGTTVMGQLQNSGTISGADNGVKVQSGSSIAGGIVNSGTITGTSGGVVVSSAAVVGNISNSGVIHGGVAGISYLNNSAASGGIFNSGVISGGTVGVALVSSPMQGPISNMAGGTISGGQYGVALSKGSISGSLANAGVISGGSAGVMLVASSIQGSINNMGGATISGSQNGLALSNSTVSGGLTNAGVISGGSYSVLVAGGAPLPIVIAGANTAAFIGDVKAPTSDVTIASGATFSGTNAFDVQSFTVEDGAKFNFGAMPSRATGAAGVTVTQGLANAGTVAVGLATASLSGNYTQAASGVLALGTSGKTGYGKLVASGTASLSSDANIFVNVGTNTTLANHETLAGILQSSGLTASTFDVTDNSNLYSFKGQGDGNNVDLVVSIDAVLLPATIARGNVNAEGAAAAFDSIITSSSAGGSFSSLINDLAKLQTNKELSHAASQLVPALSGEANIAILGALQQMNDVVQSRTEGNLGLSSGNPYLSESAAWIKPFGSWADLGSTGAAPGFSSGVEGVMIGGDGALSDRARVGLAFGYANADVSGNADSAPNQDRINLYQLMGYGSYIVMPGTELNAQLDGGYDTNDTSRNIEFTGQKASASFNSTDAHFGVGIAHPLALSDTTTLVPSARIDYTWVQSDGYLEGGAGPINLRTSSTSYEQLITSVNGKVLQRVNDFMTLFGNVGIGYDSMARNSTAIVASFAGAPGLPFTTQGVGLKPQVFLGGVGVTSQAHGMTPEISAKYDVERRSGFSNQTVSFKARWAF